MDNSVMKYTQKIVRTIDQKRKQTKNMSLPRICICIFLAMAEYAACAGHVVLSFKLKMKIKKVMGPLRF